jgi:hypothetical protein
MVKQEIYLLTKHANFSPEYVKSMTVYDRRYNIHLLEEEIEMVRKHRENEERKAKAKTRR